MRSAKSVSRRQFLRRTAPSGARGHRRAVSTSFRSAGRRRPPGANDRIGIAGIGIGRQGSGVLAQTLKQPECRFVAIADVNRPRADAIAKKHGGTGLKDYRKILDRKDVDAIITATPEHWRALICIHACQAGKDVLCGKAGEPHDPRRPADGPGRAQI